MIAKGNTHNSGARLAAYVLKTKPGERVEMGEVRGFASNDIREAFRSVDAMAVGTQCEKPLFHAQVRCPDGEHLSREQWQHVANRIESKLGLAGQARAITFHINEQTGDAHMHVGWSRIEEETMTAKNLAFFKFRLKEVSRELETELGLTPVTNHRERPDMAPTHDEDEQARRLGVDIHTVRGNIRECWERSDNGHSFAAALAGEGLTLAKGERRDFIVIDQEGGIHALGKRILGSTAGEVRARCADLDRESLPTVEQAREQSTVMRDARAANLAWEDALAKGAITKEKIEGRFAEPARHFFEAQGLGGEKPLTPADLNAWYASLDHAAGHDVEHVAAMGVSPQHEPDAPAARPEDTETRQIERNGSTLDLGGAVGGIIGAVAEAGSAISAMGALFGLDKPAPPQSNEEAQARREVRDRRAIAYEKASEDRSYAQQVDTQERERKEREAEERERARKRRYDRQL
jgi:MobA/VirD2-like, nuclease domain